MCLTGGSGRQVAQVRQQKDGAEGNTVFVPAPPGLQPVPAGCVMRSHHFANCGAPTPERTSDTHVKQVLISGRWVVAMVTRQSVISQVFSPKLKCKSESTDSQLGGEVFIQWC